MSSEKNLKQKKVPSNLGHFSLTFAAAFFQALFVFFFPRFFASTSTHSLVSFDSGMDPDVWLGKLRRVVLLLHATDNPMKPSLARCETSLESRDLQQCITGNGEGLAEMGHVLHQENGPEETSCCHFDAACPL